MSTITTLDIIMLPVTFLYIFSLIFLATYLKNKEKVSGSLARKIVHIGVGSVVILLPWFFSSNTIPVLIGIGFIFITYLTSPASIIESFKLGAFEQGHSYGTVYYAISFTTILYFYFEEFWIVASCFLPLVFGDAFANIIGEKYGRHILFQNKSLEGAFGGFIATFFILLITLVFYSYTDLVDFNAWKIASIVFFLSVLTVVSELISPKGLDNLSIPFVNLGAILLFF